MNKRKVTPKNQLKRPPPKSLYKRSVEAKSSRSTSDSSEKSSSDYEVMSAFGAKKQAETNMRSLPRTEKSNQKVNEPREQLIDIACQNKDQNRGLYNLTLRYGGYIDFKLGNNLRLSL